MSPVTIKKTNKAKEKDKGKTNAQWCLSINPRRRKKNVNSPSPIFTLLLLLLLPLDILADNAGGSSPWEASLRYLCARNLGRLWPPDLGLIRVMKGG
jgi:hypothetical protein